MQKISIAKLIFVFLITFYWQPLIACDDGCACTASYTFDTVRSSITADTLNNLINNNSEIILLEYRSPVQETNISIPNAKIILENSDKSLISTLIPASDTLIIVYPGIEGANIASLTESIRALGYNSIIEYQDGVYGWMTYGYEVATEITNAK